MSKNAIQVNTWDPHYGFKTVLAHRKTFWEGWGYIFTVPIIASSLSSFYPWSLPTGYRLDFTLLFLPPLSSPVSLSPLPLYFLYPIPYSHLNNNKQNNNNNI